MAHGDDYADLVGLALALIEKKRCPMCDAKQWKTIPVTAELPLTARGPAHAVPVVCGDCGYTHLFLCAYLQKKARRLNAEMN